MADDIEFVNGLIVKATRGLLRGVQRSKGARSTEGLCLAGSNEERRST